MPIEKPNNNLYRIRELSVGVSGSDYYLSMNPGKAKACVLCISRQGVMRAEELSLSEDNLSFLYSGGKLEFPDYTLQGITGHQLAALAQYRNFQLKPPVYVQAWAMTTAQSGIILYIPEDIESQMTLVPVHYWVIVNGNSLMVKVDDAEGYQDGDLMYQQDGRLPIPIPKSAIGQRIPLRNSGDKYSVLPAPNVANNYIQKNN